MKRVPSSLTIRDVARHAGVGIATVSRVLNGGRQVSPQTHARVVAAMHELVYRPLVHARRILRRRAGMVCFLLSNRDFLHGLHARILQGVESYASAVSQHVVYAALHYDENTPPNRIPLPPILRERGWVDGLILAGTTYTNFLRRIESIHVPVVAFGNNVVGLGAGDHLDQVRFDGAKAEFRATQYVIEQGHRQIAFVADTRYPWFLERYEGYLEALRAHGLEPLSCTSPREDRFTEYGDWAASCVLSMSPRPTAIMAGNDEIAYGLWRTFRRLGIHVPGEISLVGFDDREEARLMDPHLTTISVPKELIGESLMRLLLEKLERPGTFLGERIVPTELVVRDTVNRL
jgi:DNA-binding LacI/PurR family transcriptional regulator